MADFFDRLRARFTAPEVKRSATHQLIALAHPGRAVWTPRNYASLAAAGFERNVVVNRCIRMIAEAAASAPLRVVENGVALSDHPLVALLAQPNPDEPGAALLERFYGFLQTAGNAYVEAVALDGAVRELHILRPDRMKIRLGAHGRPDAYEYAVNGRSVVFPMSDGFSPILHLKLFHPTNDHYGHAPLEAAATAVDVHNASTAWNKALLDNAARPSGALVYKGPDGAENLSADQFSRLKTELETAYAGTENAGRPLLLDGGLDWKSMSMTPAEMDFVGAKNAAAREIALAFGVPPMLLGIPGDNTYANYREANLAFWRQTVLPLVKKTAAALSAWLSPQFDGVRIVCEAGDLDALAGERDARWVRIAAADFLTTDEKREALGFAPAGEGEAAS